MKKLSKYKLVPITKIENISNTETQVFDLSVETDHSYCANGIIVHNCLTTKNTGVGYPMASLIKETYLVSTLLKEPAKIVADGGMKDYSDIIKALALGADYVMIGSIFNKAIESRGDSYLFKKIKISNKLAKKLYKLGLPIYKKFRGMSTKEVQKDYGKKNLKTSEGVVRYRKVEYELSSWVDNFRSYLSSAMSYTNKKTITEFIGNVETIQITQNAYKRYDK